MTSSTPFRPLRRALLIAAAASLGLPALAQTYPSQPIRLLVGYSAGGGMDSMARLIAHKLDGLLGQQVIVENRAGASGLIAADVVAKSAPDGYTLLLGESGLLAAQHLQPRTQTDPVKGLAPVAGLFRAPLMIVAQPSFPATTPKALIDLLKANPGKYSYANPGVGTIHQLGFEMFKERTGTVVASIPYRGAAQILTDVMGGQVPLGVASAAAAIPLIKAGKLRGIAMMSTDRLPGAENVPALDTVLPGFDVAPRVFVLAPRGTPAAVVRRLEDALKATVADPGVVQAASQLGAVVAFTPATTLGPELERESAHWGQLIVKYGISAQ